MNHYTVGIAIIGALTGIVGVVLGVVNTVHIVAVDKIRLRVIPEYAITPYGEGFVVEVQNLSYMPITVKNMGILLSNGQTMAIGISLLNANRLPKRIPVRESVTFSIVLPVTGFPAYKVDVKTGGGLTFKGTSNVFKDIVKKARAVVKNRT